MPKRRASWPTSARSPRSSAACPRITTSISAPARRSTISPPSSFGTSDPTASIAPFTAISPLRTSLQRTCPSSEPTLPDLLSGPPSQLQSELRGVFHALRAHFSMTGQKHRPLIQKVLVVQPLRHVFLGDVADVLADEGLDFELEAVFEEGFDLALPALVLLKPGIAGDL